MANVHELASEQARDESIPHISWGKYIKHDDQFELGISIEVNHRLIDGLHVGNIVNQCHQCGDSRVELDILNILADFLDSLVEGAL